MLRVLCAGFVLLLACYVRAAQLLADRGRAVSWACMLLCKCVRRWIHHITSNGNEVERHEEWASAEVYTYTRRAAGRWFGRVGAGRRLLWPSRLWVPQQQPRPGGLQTLMYYNIRRLTPTRAPARRGSRSPSCSSSTWVEKGRDALQARQHDAFTPARACAGNHAPGCDAQLGSRTPPTVCAHALRNRRTRG